jgi:hypothetical protein
VASSRQQLLLQLLGSGKLRVIPYSNDPLLNFFPFCRVATGIGGAKTLDVEETLSDDVGFF